MSKIGYQVLKCVNPINKKVGFRASTARYSLIEADAVVNYASENCNINRNIIAAAMAGLCQAIRQFALNGHNVVVGGLGCFMVSNTSEGSADSSDVTANNVKAVKVGLRLNSAIKREAKNIKLFRYV